MKVSRRSEIRSNAAYYTSRPCYILGESLHWAVLGGYADESGGGVLAWCYDERDALQALSALKATGDYTNLTIENLGGGR